MESVRFTIVAGQFNTQRGRGIITDVSQLIPWDSNIEYYPREVTIINNTTATLGVLYLTSEEYDNRFIQYPAFYAHTELLGDTIAELPLYTNYIVFRMLAGFAAGDLEFYCRNYFRP